MRTIIIYHRSRKSQVTYSHIIHLYRFTRSLRSGTSPSLYKAGKPIFCSLRSPSATPRRVFHTLCSGSIHTPTRHSPRLVIMCPNPSRRLFPAVSFRSFFIIRRIDEYELPSDEQLHLQAVDKIICSNRCMYNKHCNGFCIASPKWHESMRAVLFNTK